MKGTTGKLALARYNARLSEDDRAGEAILEKIQNDFLSLFFGKYDAEAERFLSKLPALIKGSPEEAAERLANFFKKQFGTKFTDSVSNDLRKAVANVWKAGGTIPFRTDWKKRPENKEAVDFFHRANHFDIKGAFERFSDEIKATALEALKTGDRAKALKALQKAMPGLTGDVRMKDRLDDTFRGLTNRAFTFSRVKRLEQNGVARVEVVVVMDRRTSAICKAMDGKSFQVATASAFIDEFISTPYDEEFWNKFKQPNWEPSAQEVEEAGSRASAINKKIAPFKKMSGDEIVKMLGLQVPPFHFKCRTTLIAVITKLSAYFRKQNEEKK